MQQNTHYSEGQRLWLSGDKAGACWAFIRAGSNANRAMRAACEALVMWCQNKGQGQELSVIELLSDAVLRGHGDLKAMLVLGIVADEAYNRLVLSPIQKLALKQLAVEALRVGSEVPGVVLARIQEVDGEVVSYRLAAAEHNLRRRRERFMEDARTYDMLLSRAMATRKGRVEAAVAVARSLICYEIIDVSYPAVDVAVAESGDLNHND